MHQTEALLGILIECKDERAKGLLADLSKVSLGVLKYGPLWSLQTPARFWYNSNRQRPTAAPLFNLFGA
jgi:hypothetical protein